MPGPCQICLICLTNRACSRFVLVPRPGLFPHAAGQPGPVTVGGGEVGEGCPQVRATSDCRNGKILQPRAFGASPLGRLASRGPGTRGQDDRQSDKQDDKGTLPDSLSFCHSCLETL